MPKLPILAASLLLAFLLIASSPVADAQTQFRIGERITYTVSLDKYKEAAYAELYCVSRGALAGKDAIELRSKIKTLNLVSAAVAQVDGVRTTFVDPETGSPLYISRIDNTGGLPKETVNDYRQAAAANFDLPSLIYRIRHMGGSGTANFQEGDRVYSVAFSPSGTEKVLVPAGEFETTVISVQSEYFSDLGFIDVKINLTADDARVPVLIRLNKTKKSGYRVEAASIQMIAPEQPEVRPTPSPSPVIPVVTPRPTATPEPYVPNRALAPELAFQLGETLEYRITAGDRPVGSLVTRARERVEVVGRDTLILSATVTNAAPGNPIVALNDSIVVNVDPLSLAPYTIDVRTRGPLASLSQSASFDDRTGSITFKGGKVDAPIATHSILSLIYAMRSFNLKPSQVRERPVNDTRVAVFWESRPYVFTLRPLEPAEININGQKRQAQQITINTGNAQLDQLSIKVWLSMDSSRTPLRFSIGQYQADLVATSIVPPSR